MATMRKSKKLLKDILTRDDWQEHLEEIAHGGHDNVGALFSFLLYDPVLAHRAAAALGKTVAHIHTQNKEAAKIIIRRFMWHLNEDSGNIGWGIPFAFAETLAASPELAKDYGRILLTYIYDLGFADNYCDYGPLRRQCYWAVGRFAQADSKLAEQARPWLVKGLEDEDSICRGMAAWALTQLPPSLMDAPALRKLASANNNDECEIFDHGQLERHGVSELAAMALGSKTARAD